MPDGLKSTLVVSQSTLPYSLTWTGSWTRTRGARRRSAGTSVSGASDDGGRSADGATSRATLARTPPISALSSTIRTRTALVASLRDLRRDAEPRMSKSNASGGDGVRKAERRFRENWKREDPALLRARAVLGSGSRRIPHAKVARAAVQRQGPGRRQAGARTLPGQGCVC